MLVPKELLFLRGPRGAWDKYEARTATLIGLALVRVSVPVMIKMQAEGQISTSAAWCVFYGAGIIGTLVLYGILQEGIMTVAYDGNLFQYSVFLVLCNRLAAVIFAVGMTAAKGESMQNAAPLWKYLIVSLSNVYASSCQYEALKYVSFAVQMLGKSFKMMPVMIWGIIIAGKAYSGRDWLVALTVTLGCTEFLMTGPTHSKVDASNSFKGFLLLGCFLALDGLTSTFQEKLFKEHKTTKYNQMLYINLLSATVSFITLLATGAAPPFECAWQPGVEHALTAAMQSESSNPHKPSHPEQPDLNLGESSGSKTQASQTFSISSSSKPSVDVIYSPCRMKL
ncbi:slc35b2 [Symbiodinium sp. KB8]|nr:slc35b2 [Symbiodinium sp. KB8]